MGGFRMDQAPQGEDPEKFWSQQSGLYSSVMFKSIDGGETWGKYKQKGVGAIDKIMQERANWLPPPQRKADDRKCKLFDGFKYTFDLKSHNDEPWGIDMNYSDWTVDNVYEG